VPTSDISLIAKDRLFDNLDLEEEFVVVVISVTSLLNVERRLERLNPLALITIIKIVTHRSSESSELATLLKALPRFELSDTSSALTRVSARDTVTEAVSVSESSSNGRSRPNELFGSWVNVCLSIEVGS